MRLTVLAVPGCPGAAMLEERLTVALADRLGTQVTRLEIADELAAEQAGMHGSPTLLVNGTDPFVAPGQAASLSCRLYRDENGRPTPAPSVESLREAIAFAGDD